MPSRPLLCHSRTAKESMLYVSVIGVATQRAGPVTCRMIRHIIDKPVKHVLPSMQPLVGPSGDYSHLLPFKIVSFCASFESQSFHHFGYKLMKLNKPVFIFLKEVVSWLFVGAEMQNVDVIVFLLIALTDRACRCEAQLM